MSNSSQWWNERIGYVLWESEEFIQVNTLEEYQKMIEIVNDNIKVNHLIALFKRIHETNQEFESELIDYLVESHIPKQTKKSFLLEYLNPKDLYEIKDIILRMYHIKHIEESGELALYSNGVYERNKERRIKAINSTFLKELGYSFTTATANNLLAVIKNSTLTSIKEFDNDPYILNVENGLLNILTGSFKKHNPNHMSLRRIPLIFDDEAICPEIDDFFIQIFHKEDIPFMEEWMGLNLTPIMIYQIALLLYGSGRNGKTTFLNLLEIFFGKENISKIDISKFKNDQFFAQLENALANICADIDDKTTINIQRFKDWVGNTVSMLIKRLYHDPYPINPKAKCTYSCNTKFPNVPETTDIGFWRKWTFIECPNEFERDKEIADKLDHLTNQKELSGLLNKAIKGFQRLHKRGRFDEEYYDWETIRDLWVGNKDIVQEYINEIGFDDVEAFVIQKEFVNRINKWLKEKGRLSLHTGTITKKINSKPKYDQDRKRINGVITKIYRGFRFKDQPIEIEQLQLNINGEIND